MFLVLVLVTLVALQNGLCSDDRLKLDCGPDRDRVTEMSCQNRGCIWEEAAPGGDIPFCFYPPNFGYKVDKAEVDNAKTTKRRWVLEPLQQSQRYKSPLTLNLEVIEEGPKRVQLKVTDRNAKRYEIPEDIMKLKSPTDTSGDKLFEVLLDSAMKSLPSKSLSLKVKRKDGSIPILDTTDLPGMTFEDQFIQISFRLPTSYVYGLGENQRSAFKRSFDNTIIPMFAKSDSGDFLDEKKKNYKNLYGAHPFFLGMDTDGKAYGVLFWNSNAQEVILLPGNILTYRTIGGILDIRVMFGPTPQDVFQQYHQMIGQTYFPPYWALGFQLSKYWYGNLDTVKSVRDEMRLNKIPWDVQQFDIDYMHRKLNFTVDPERFGGLKHYIEELHNDGMKAVILLDPNISRQEASNTYHPYDSGVKQGVFLKETELQKDEESKKHKEKPELVVGKMWADQPGTSYEFCDKLPWNDANEQCRAQSHFVDWLKDATKDWWKDNIVRFHKAEEGLSFDGLWIDMNEPENFLTKSPHNIWNDPPYMPHVRHRDQALGYKTISMSAMTTVGNEEILMYNTHSLYGYGQAKCTMPAAIAATGKRPMVFSRSTFPGSGALVGKWLGDAATTWETMRQSVVGILDMNMFGIAYTGADICGFFASASGHAGETPAELCFRWMQLGAFYTFSRNHGVKDKPPQHPAAYGQDFAKAMRKVLTTRYQLLPYLYTIMYEANKYGGTVLRSLLEEFHEDHETWEISTQFMWGKGLLITPVLEKGETKVEGYVPKGRWYDFYTGKELEKSGKQTFHSPSENWHGNIPLHLRGGQILPAQEASVTTTESRKNRMWIIAAIDENGAAKGTLYWDEGDSLLEIAATEHLTAEIHLETTNGVKLTVVPTVAQPKKGQERYSPTIEWGKVFVYGLPGPVQPSSDVQHMEYNEETKLLTFHISHLVTEAFTLELPYVKRESVSPLGVQKKHKGSHGRQLRKKHRHRRGRKGKKHRSSRSRVLQRGRWQRAGKH